MIDVSVIKAAAAGRWREILAEIGGIDPALLDGIHHPCPKCGGTDRFRVFDNFRETGGVHCNQCHNRKNGDGISALQWALGIDFKATLAKLADYLGLRNGDGRATARKRKKRRNATATKSGKTPAATIDAQKNKENEFTTFRPDDWSEGTDRLFQLLAVQLGVSTESLERLDIGHSSKHRAWTFPMRNADGKIVGYRLRRSDGKKLSVSGGHEGLFISGGLDLATTDGVLFVAEGPSDTAALLDQGFSVIGLPSAGGAIKHAVEFVRKHRPSAVVIVADADEAGQRGAKKLAAALVGTFPDLPVKIITPPTPHKDIRDWKKAGATTADVQAEIDAAAT